MNWDHIEGDWKLFVRTSRKSEQANRRQSDPDQP